MGATWLQYWIMLLEIFFSDTRILFFRLYLEKGGSIKSYRTPIIIKLIFFGIRKISRTFVSALQYGQNFSVMIREFWVKWRKPQKGNSQCREVDERKRKERQRLHLLWTWTAHEGIRRIYQITERLETKRGLKPAICGFSPLLYVYWKYYWQCFTEI